MGRRLEVIYLGVNDHRGTFGAVGIWGRKFFFCKKRRNGTLPWSLSINNASATVTVTFPNTGGEDERVTGLSGDHAGYREDTRVQGGEVACLRS